MTFFKAYRGDFQYELSVLPFTMIFQHYSGAKHVPLFGTAPRVGASKLYNYTAYKTTVSRYPRFEFASGK